MLRSPGRRLGILLIEHVHIFNTLNTRVTLFHLREVHQLASRIDPDAAGHMVQFFRARGCYSDVASVQFTRGPLTFHSQQCIQKKADLTPHVFVVILFFAFAKTGEPDNGKGAAFCTRFFRARYRRRPFCFST